MSKKSRTIIATASAAVMAVAALSYLADIHYIEPTNDLRAFGVYWVKYWTPRRIDHESWIDSSQTIYRFRISQEQETELRKRCDPRSVPGCYIGRKEVKPNTSVVLEVQRGWLMLYYTVT